MSVGFTYHHGDEPYEDDRTEECEHCGENCKELEMLNTKEDKELWVCYDCMELYLCIDCNMFDETTKKRSDGDMVCDECAEDNYCIKCGRVFIFTLGRDEKCPVCDEQPAKLGKELTDALRNIGGDL